MTDVVTSADRSDRRLAFSRLADLGSLLKRSDLGLAVGVMAILVVLILPLPSLLLDFALAISITFSVLILMTSLFIQAPLEFSAFPTVLLIATMLRLALNLASTRLILARGHEGTDAAGHVIQAFGNFVMAGNFIIGIIVFTILVIVIGRSECFVYGALSAFPDIDRDPPARWGNVWGNALRSPLVRDSAFGGQPRKRMGAQFAGDCAAVECDARAALAAAWPSTRVVTAMEL